ncbi:hypothetical protein Tco_1331273, partial [Tanacetum coccineum]
GKKNEFTNTGLTQLEKQPPDILTHTQAPGTLEALDFVRMRYASGCNVPSIGDPTGVFVLPFGGVSAFEEMLNLLAVPSANWRTDNTQLYLNVFQKCSEFCGGNLQRELTTTFRVVCRTEDAKLYSDVYQKYCQGCEGVSRKGPNTISKGTSLAADVMRMDCESQKLMPTDAADIFQAYSALCSRDIGGRRSVNVRQTTTIFDRVLFFRHSQHGPSTSLGGRNAHGNSKVNLTTVEATCSRGIGGRPSLNVLLVSVLTSSEATVQGNREVGLATGEATCSRGIRRRPSVKTGPSTSRGGRNTHVNPGVSLTTAEATCSSGISRCRLVRHRPSIRGPTVGSSSYTYTDFGDSDQRCYHCGDSFCYGERLKGQSHNQRSEYHLCCGRGAKIDESINAGRGPYVFKVSGQIYHRIGSLCPPPGEAPRFLQLYIYDTDNEVENKMRHFGG